MTEIADDERQRIIEALYAGRKIDAIKVYRQATNSDLLTAKSFVEGLEARLRSETPERFAASPVQGCGCSAMLLVVILVFLLGGAVGAYVALRLPQQAPAPAAP
jgi:hypothetical protein